MAQQKTERMDKKVRDEMLRQLAGRVKDPTLYTVKQLPQEKSSIANTAIGLLKIDSLLTWDGYITIAGMDHHRRETMRCRWVRENWFPVFVAVLTAGATLGAGILTVWFGNRAC